MKARYLLTILLLASGALAQSPRDRRAIAVAKSIPIAQLDPRLLPSIPFERWLAHEAGARAKIDWEVNDCGEQTGTPADRGRDFPMCVEATAHMADGRTIVVRVAVGTFNKGIQGKPVATWITVGWDPASDRPLKTLSDVPFALVGTRHGKPTDRINDNPGTAKVCSCHLPAPLSIVIPQWICPAPAEYPYRFQLPITNYQFPITNYRQLTTGN